MITLNKPDALDTNFCAVESCTWFIDADGDLAYKTDESDDNGSYYSVVFQTGSDAPMLIRYDDDQKCKVLDRDPNIDIQVEGE